MNLDNLTERFAGVLPCFPQPRTTHYPDNRAWDSGFNFKKLLCVSRVVDFSPLAVLGAASQSIHPVDRSLCPHRVLPSLEVWYKWNPFLRTLFPIPTMENRLGRLSMSCSLPYDLFLTDSKEPLC